MRVLLLSAQKEEEVARRLRRKRTVKIVAVLLVLVVAFTLFFAIVLDVHSLGVGKGSTDGAYGTVLADIDGIKEANPRIIDILFAVTNATQFFTKSKVGEWTDDYANFQVEEITGQVGPYNDFGDGAGNIRGRRAPVENFGVVNLAVC